MPIYQQPPRLKPMIFRLFLFCMTYGLTCCNAAFAWDAEGHRLSVHIAQQFLSDNTRKAIHELLEGSDLSAASTWMDRHRKQLGAPYDKWHYDNRPVCDERANTRQYCADGNCLSQQLPAQIKQLANSRLNQYERAKSLRIVTHLVGDLHQPLHTGDHNDRGGNQINAVLTRGARKTVMNLHAYWDSEVLDLARKGERDKAFAKRLLQQYAEQLTPWMQGTPTQWQQQTYALSQQFTYTALPDFGCNTTRDNDAFLLTENYEQAAAEHAAQQIVKAGLRLAKVLNEALDSGRMVSNP